MFLLTAGTSVTFANSYTDPDQRTLEEFKKEFASAQCVTWEKQDEFDKATFMLIGHRVIAFFNKAGKLEGSVRDIFFDQVPLNVMTAVDKRFANAEIINVKEISNADGTNYLVTLEKKNKKYRIKVNSTSGIVETEKLKM